MTINSYIVVERSSEVDTPSIVVWERDLRRKILKIT